jgi:hypothetical protein
MKSLCQISQIKKNKSTGISRIWNKKQKLILKKETMNHDT